MGGNFNMTNQSTLNQRPEESYFAGEHFVPGRNLQGFVLSPECMGGLVLVTALCLPEPSCTDALPHHNVPVNCIWLQGCALSSKSLGARAHGLSPWLLMP